MLRYLQYYEGDNGIYYRLNDERVLAIKEGSCSKSPWPSFSKAYETPSAFLLLCGDGTVYIFPKVCFGDEQKVKQMRGLLNVKLPGMRIYK